jgi:glycosyltransferase involved in cell wall biosynthesis
LATAICARLRPAKRLLPLVVESHEIPGRDLLVEDQPVAFADAVNRLLADPDLAARMGQSARRLAVERYVWSGAARALEGFYRRILEVRW